MKKLCKFKKMRANRVFEKSRGKGFKKNNKNQPKILTKASVEVW